MKKVLGILGLLVFVILVTAWRSDHFINAYNIENVLRRSSLFGILSVGVMFVIISGGIDLSLGSVVSLVGCLLPFLLTKHGWSVPAALLAVTAVALSIGLAQGLLVAKLKLQPFVVTLCGLLLYRGIARGMTGDQTQGFGNDFLALRTLSTGKLAVLGTGSFAIPAPMLFFAVVALAAAVLLQRTIYGRYLLALGRNEQAARYSGINTERMILLAYVLSALLAGLGGVLFVLDVNSAQPADFGNFYELYAIAAAVLGGCSLRGGHGSVVGVVVGAAVLQVLRNAITLLDIPTQLEFAIIGAALLAGAIADELLKRLAARRRRAT